MAGIGQLLLDAGRWNSARIVPEDWITAPLRPAQATLDPACSDGYQIRFHESGEGVDVVEMGGLGGQGVLVVRDFDLVLVPTGGE